MTIDERLARIEHVTAGMDEQWRREREEDRQLWRDTEKRLAATNDAITRMAVESQKRFAEAAEADRRLAEEFREADRALAERIAGLVSAMGKYIADK